MKKIYNLKGVKYHIQKLEEWREQEIQKRNAP